MTKIICMHSFRGGTGKSNAIANVATLLAQDGKRVGVVDTDIQSPGIHVLFGVPGNQVEQVINDFLWGNGSLEQVAIDLSGKLEQKIKGKLFLIPASIKAGEISRVLREGYDVQRLTEGIQQMNRALKLDVLLIDTHPGLNEETLLSIVLAHTLAILLRADHQDYEGTGVTVEVARQLEVPDMQLIVNQIPAGLNADEFKEKVEQAYGCPVTAVLPHSDEFMALASGGIFALQYPEHPITAQFRLIADRLSAPKLGEEGQKE